MPRPTGARITRNQSAPLWSQHGRPGGITGFAGFERLGLYGAAAGSDRHVSKAELRSLSGRTYDGPGEVVRTLIRSPSQSRFHEGTSCTKLIRH
jgi:hypothetical protein